MNIQILFKASCLTQNARQECLLRNKQPVERYLVIVGFTRDDVRDVAGSLKREMCYSAD